jgi:hypothetical protein
MREVHRRRTEQHLASGTGLQRWSALRRFLDYSRQVRYVIFRMQECVSTLSVRKPHVIVRKVNARICWVQVGCGRGLRERIQAVKRRGTVNATRLAVPLPYQCAVIAISEMGYETYDLPNSIRVTRQQNNIIHQMDVKGPAKGPT